MKNIAVSVIMPCFNSSKTLVEAINSVLQQSFTNFELVIIDDGSTDDTLLIAQSFAIKDSRIIILENKDQNHGVSHARNLGIKQSKGRYICFLDSDDYLLKNSLLLRVNALENSGYSIVFGPYLRLEKNNCLTAVVSKEYVKLTDMLRRNMIGNLTGMYDSYQLPKLLQNNIHHEDYLMWCELLRLCQGAKSIGSDYLGVYRVSGSSLSGNKIMAAIWHWNLLRNGLKINFFVAIFYQILYVYDSLINRLFLYKTIR